MGHHIHYGKLGHQGHPKTTHDITVLTDTTNITVIKAILNITVVKAIIDTTDISSLTPPKRATP